MIMATTYFDHPLLLFNNNNKKRINFFAVFNYFFIEIQLIYNVVLISAVQQSDSVIHSFSYSFPLWPIVGY